MTVSETGRVVQTKDGRWLVGARFGNRDEAALIDFPSSQGLSGPGRDYAPVVGSKMVGRSQVLRPYGRGRAPDGELERLSRNFTFEKSPWEEGNDRALCLLRTADLREHRGKALAGPWRVRRDLARYLTWIAAHGFASAILDALYHRDRTGRGQRIDTSQPEAGITVSGSAVLDKSANGRV